MEMTGNDSSDVNRSGGRPAEQFFRRTATFLTNRQKTV